MSVKKTDPKRKRKGRVKRALLVLLFLLCLSGSVCLFYFWGMEWKERATGDDFYAQLAAEAEETGTLQQSASVPITPAPGGETPGDKRGGGQTPEIWRTEEPMVTSAPLQASDEAQMRQKESVSEAWSAAAALDALEETAAPQTTAEPARTPEPTPFVNRSEINFPALWQTCPDVVGWLRLEDSVIDYPIVHGGDNDFYLHHLPDGSANAAGSIMMDQANSGDFGDDVNILHGHHMRSGTMFGGLEAYKREDYYRAHPVLRLYTPAGDYDVKIFAAYTVNGYTFGYPTSFEDETAFAQFVRKAVSATAYETDGTVEYGDSILLLSTCAYAYTGARFVVMGKIEGK